MTMTAMAASAEVPTHEFRYSRRVARGPALNLASTIAGVCALLTRAETHSLAIVLLLLMGGALFWWFVIRRVAVRIDASGVWLRGAGRAWFAWEDIERVRMVRKDGVANLAVDRSPTVRRARPAAGSARLRAQALGGRDLAVPLVGLTTEPKRVVELVQLALSVARRTRVAPNGSLRSDHAPPPEGRGSLSTRAGRPRRRRR